MLKRESERGSENGEILRVDERREKKSDVVKEERAKRGKAGGERGERDAAK